MNKLDALYEQYDRLLEMQNKDNGELTINLLQYGVTEEYYDRISKATSYLVDFYDKYLVKDEIRITVSELLDDERLENVKFCLLIDVLRCYDGLEHPTTFTTPEGIALMIMLGKVFGFGEITSYSQMREVYAATVNLNDIIPYIFDCSEELGKRHSLVMSKVLNKCMPDVDRLYRIVLYNLCKNIAEVDGEITLSEQDWLNEIALLNDGDPATDIDMTNLLNKLECI